MQNFPRLTQPVEGSPEDRVASTTESALCHVYVNPKLAEVHNAQPHTMAEDVQPCSGKP